MATYINANIAAKTKTIAKTKIAAKILAKMAKTMAANKALPATASVSSTAVQP